MTHTPRPPTNSRWQSELEIVTAETDADYVAVRTLLAEYKKWDLARTAEQGVDAHQLEQFQYAGRAAVIPGDLAPPRGCLFVARWSGVVAGCGGLRPLGVDACELKRLYVRETFRGRRIGRCLAVLLVAAARRMGYRTMRLETAVFMSEAIELYRTLGFKLCAPYGEIPEELRHLTVSMEASLRSDE